jgi:hypothetical protein
VVVVLSMLVGAACTGPPPTAEQVGTELGKGIGLVLAVIIGNVVCGLSNCPGPICVFVPCLPAATPPAATEPESVAPG